MPREVTVRTGSRLHFGPLSFRPLQGRHFGGVGMMIDRPGFVVHLCESDRDQIIGDGAVPQRARTVLAMYRSRCRRDQQPPPCRVEIAAEIPGHRGLGSGTQLGLAIARGLAELAGETNVAVETLARRVDRGKRSAVGIHGFAQGGLIVEAGHYADDDIERRKRGQTPRTSYASEDERGRKGSDPFSGDIGPLVCRVPIPEEWCVLLLTPSSAPTGLSGEGEEQAFDRLGSMPLSLTERLCHITLTELLPALRAVEFEGFSRAVFEYGRLAGGFFAPIQGGTYAHPRTEQIVQTLRELGIHGAGQTSWGPTVFAFAASQDDAEQFTARWRDTSPNIAADCDVRLIQPLNRGVRVHHRTWE